MYMYARQRREKYMYACQRREKNKKKPCRTNQEKTILEPITKGNAQRRNTQMKAMKENVKEKNRAHSCLVAQKEKPLVVFFYLDRPCNHRLRNVFFHAFPLNLRRVKEARSAEFFFLHHRLHTHFFFLAFLWKLRRGHKVRSANKKTNSSPSIAHSFFFSLSF